MDVKNQTGQTGVYESQARDWRISIHVLLEEALPGQSHISQSMTTKALCRVQWHLDWQWSSRDYVSPCWKKSSQLIKRGIAWLWLFLPQGKECGPQQCSFLFLLVAHRHMEQQKGDVLKESEYSSLELKLLRFPGHERHRLCGLLQQE